MKVSEHAEVGAREVADHRNALRFDRQNPGFHGVANHTDQKLSQRHALVLAATIRIDEMNKTSTKVSAGIDQKTLIAQNVIAIRRVPFILGVKPQIHITRFWF